LTLSAEDRLELRERCSIVVGGFRTPSPAEEFQMLADWSRANGVSHDNYGEGALIVFMPSGVMVQLAAVRIWTERARLDRFGLHPTSHLIGHEREAYQALFGLHGAVVGERLRPMTAADLTPSARR
jgi:threonine aldolase